MLLPLPEARFFRLDLLGEALAQGLLLFLELGVLELAWLLLAELADLHLSLSVVFVVKLFRRADEVEHVRANKEGAKFPEIAVILILNCRWK